jgi:hypothetical protein
MAEREHDKGRIRLMIADDHTILRQGLATEVARELVNRWQAKVLILTAFDHDEDLRQGLKAGAKGYLLKDVAREEIVDAVRTAAQGGTYLPARLAHKLAGVSPMAAPGALATRKPPANRGRHGLRAAVDVQFSKEVLHVRLDGALRNKQRGADFFVRFALAHQPQHGQFPFRQFRAEEGLLLLHETPLHLSTKED